MRVRIDFQLPGDAEALQDALVGGDALRTLRQLRGYLAERLASPAATRADYRRALEDVRAWLDRATSAEESRGDDERERDDEREIVYDR